MLEMQLSIDLLLIGRCLGALCWGILWAVFLQCNRMGKFLAVEVDADTAARWGVVGRGAQVEVVQPVRTAHAMN